MRRFLTTTAVILATLGAARADILPPGAKWVSHVVKFDGLDRYQKDYVFYVYPRDLGRGRPGNSSLPVSDRGEVGISGMNPLATRDGVFLFAIPKKLHGDEKVPKEEWFEGNGEGVLKSEPLVRATRALDKSDKRDKVTTTYRIEIKDRIKLTMIQEDKPAPKPGEEPAAVRTDEERPYGSRLGWIFGGGAAGLAVVSGLWLVRRRKG